MGHKEMQQLELCWAHFKCFVSQNHPPAVDLQNQLADPKLTARAITPRTPQYRLHPCDPLLGSEGLGDVIIGPHLKTLNDIVLVGFCRQHNDRKRLSGLLLLQPPK